MRRFLASTVTVSLVLAFGIGSLRAEGREPESSAERATETPALETPGVPENSQGPGAGTVALAPAPASSGASPALPPAPASSGASPTLPPAADDAPQDAGTAGVYNGTFFVRDRKDALRLYLQGRTMIDFYSFHGAGVGQVSSLNPTFLLRKVRLELGGEAYRKVQWFFGGDFGMNSTGLGANQAVALRAAPVDVFVNFKADALLNVELGQFDQPFTAESRTADKFLPFMERSLAVRIVGKGNAKDTGLMLWGNLDQRLVSYAVSLVQGDGMNRPNVDHRFDLIARIFTRPLARGGSPLRDLQIGGSVRSGSRDGRRVAYDYPAMTTEGSYTFWKPTYGAAQSANSPQGQTHVIPSGSQLLAAVELRVPLQFFDVTLEGVFGHENTREAQDANLYQSLRHGTLKSFGYYAQVGLWPFGNAYVNGIPGDQAPTSVDFSKPDRAPAPALQLLLRWEQLAAKYEGNERSGATPSGIDGKIKVNALSFGASYWLGKLLRVSVNYGINWFPGSAPSSSWTAKQRAQAPGNTLAAGVDDSAREHAHGLHELLGRVQVAF
jgi:phosphate-selective porin